MWKYGFASVAGTSHVKASLPVQDVSRAEVIFDARGEEVLVAVASDGTGSAPHAQLGAALACDLLMSEVRTHFAGAGSWQQLADGFIGSWIEKFQESVISASGQAQSKLSDFACTLLAAVIGRECAVYFQLGDGAMVVTDRDEPDRYAVVCWPQQGEYANTTNFLTDADAAEKVFCELRQGAVDEAALFTDGLQNLVLDYRAQAAHAPFFAPLFAWLQARDAGRSLELAERLTGYLNSEKINARTDDDKTLILATRR
jgi:hypothetical protein